jgi:Uncharacterized conserved protein (COG2071)
MLAALRRHPFAVEAFFRWSLVVTYALPPRALSPLLPRGLTLDTYGEGPEECAFLAIALVQTERLRPKGLPAFVGRDFFLSGYRIFARFPRPGRPTLRGLRILRSDTDRRMMVHLGNLFTHYGYRHARVATMRSGNQIEVDVRTPSGEADFHVRADLSKTTTLPERSPFRSMADARRFAGPLPHTFDADVDPTRMLIVRGVRAHWDPRPVRILAHASSFLAGPAFARDEPRLANAFYVENVPYAWRPGVLEAIA